MHTLEKELYLEAAKYNIVPEVISTDGLNVKTKFYPFLLMDIPLQHRSEYIQLLKAKLQQLHNIDIIHLDVSDTNVVMDGKDLRLIDLGCSKRFADVDEDDFKESYDWIPIKSYDLAGLLERELACADFICGVRPPK